MTTRRVLLRAQTTTHMACLYAIHAHTSDDGSGPTKALLEVAMRVSRDTVTRAVAHCREQRLIESSPVAGYRLTPAGRAALRHAVAVATRPDGTFAVLADATMDVDTLIESVRELAGDDDAPVVLHPLAAIAYEPKRSAHNWTALAERVDVEAVGKGLGHSRKRVTVEGQASLALDSTTSARTTSKGERRATDTVGTP